MDMFLYILVGVFAVLGLLFFALVRIVRVKADPPQALIVQGLTDVRRVVGPGWRFHWAWETGIMIPSEVISVNIDSEDATTYITPDNSDEPAPVTMRANEISVDLQFQLTDDDDLNVQNAKDFLQHRNMLYNTIQGDDGEIRYEADELIADAVQGAFRRYCADTSIPFMKLIYDTGAVAEHILISVRSYQRSKESERNQLRAWMIKEMLANQQLKAEELQRQYVKKITQLLTKVKGFDADEIDRAKNGLLASFRAAQAALVQESQGFEAKALLLLPKIERGSKKDKEPGNFWGVSFIKVTVEEIQPADPKVKEAMEKAAEVLQLERAEIAIARKDIKVAELRVDEATEKGKAKTAFLTPLGLTVEDGKVADYQLKLEMFDMLAKALGGGNGLMVHTDIMGQVQQLLAGGKDSS